MLCMTSTEAYRESSQIKKKKGISLFFFKVMYIPNFQVYKKVYKVYKKLCISLTFIQIDRHTFGISWIKAVQTRRLSRCWGNLGGEELICKKQCVVGKTLLCVYSTALFISYHPLSNQPDMRSENQQVDPCVLICNECFCVFLMSCSKYVRGFWKDLQSKELESKEFHCTV